MAWDIAKSENIGGREEQQDRVEVFPARGRPDCLLVVADGMGGHQGGALAARTVVDTAREIWQAEEAIPADPLALVSGICATAHERVNQAGSDAGLDPRSTCVILYGDREHVTWASVGDSRLYHFRAGELAFRSRDQSVVQMLVDMGKIDESEMADHPDQNRLLQSLGGEEAPEIQTGTIGLEKADAFLLCSDGLWETVSKEEMAAATDAASLRKGIDALVRKAASRGGAGGDNIAVAVGRPARSRGFPRWRVLLLLVALVMVAAATFAWVILPPASRLDLGRIPADIAPAAPVEEEAAPTGEDAATGATGARTAGPREDRSGTRIGIPDGEGPGGDTEPPSQETRSGDN